MVRYYCDYCDSFLTHDSPAVRKQHNTGYKHKSNVKSYYIQFEEAQVQDAIQEQVKGYQQGGGPMGMPPHGMMPRPGFPGGPPPFMGGPPRPGFPMMPPRPGMGMPPFMGRPGFHGGPRPPYMGMGGPPRPGFGGGPPPPLSMPPRPGMPPPGGPPPGQ